MNSFVPGGDSANFPRSGNDLLIDTANEKTSKVTHAQTDEEVVWHEMIEEWFAYL